MLQFHEKTTTIWDYFIIKKRYLGLKIRKRVEKSKRDFKRITGYTWDDFLNAVTVASLIQISIKLLLSIFGIKIALWLHVFLLLFFITLSLYFDFFQNLNDQIIYFCKNKAHPFLYDLYLPEDFVWDELDESELLEFNIKNTPLQYYLLETILNFFVYLRLCFFAEPLLFNLSKFVLLTWFLYDYNLVLAYLLSFLIIFSRFIFFMTDKSFSKLKAPLTKLNLLHNGTIIMATLHNTVFITSWVLRILCIKELNKGTNQLYGLQYNYIQTMLQRKQRLVELQQRSPHLYYKALFILLLAVIFFFFVDPKKRVYQLCDVVFSHITKEQTFLQDVLRPVKSHVCYRTIDKNDDGTITTITHALTSLYTPGPTKSVLAAVPKISINFGKENQAISAIGYKQTILPPAEFEKKKLLKIFPYHNSKDIEMCKNVLTERTPILVDLDLMKTYSQPVEVLYLTIATSRTNKPLSLPYEFYYNLYSIANSDLLNHEKTELLMLACEFMHANPSCVAPAFTQIIPAIKHAKAAILDLPEKKILANDHTFENAKNNSFNAFRQFEQQINFAKKNPVVFQPYDSDDSLI